MIGLVPGVIFAMPALGRESACLNLLTLGEHASAGDVELAQKRFGETSRELHLGHQARADPRGHAFLDLRGKAILVLSAS